MVFLNKNEVSIDAYSRVRKCYRLSKGLWPCARVTIKIGPTFARSPQEIIPEIVLVGFSDGCFTVGP